MFLFLFGSQWLFEVIIPVNFIYLWSRWNGIKDVEEINIFYGVCMHISTDICVCLCVFLFHAKFLLP